jgi:hypothetical protein
VQPRGQPQCTQILKPACLAAHSLLYAMFARLPCVLAMSHSQCSSKIMPAALLLSIIHPDAAALHLHRIVHMLLCRLFCVCRCVLACHPPVCPHQACHLSALPSKHCSSSSSGGTQALAAAAAAGDASAVRFCCWRGLGWCGRAAAAAPCRHANAGSVHGYAEEALLVQLFVWA